MSSTDIVVFVSFHAYALVRVCLSHATGSAIGITDASHASALMAAIVVIRNCSPVEVIALVFVCHPSLIILFCTVSLPLDAVFGLQRWHNRQFPCAWTGSACAARGLRGHAHGRLCGARLVRNDRLLSCLFFGRGNTVEATPLAVSENSSILVQETFHWLRRN